MPYKLRCRFEAVEDEGIGAENGEKFAYSFYIEVMFRFVFCWVMIVNVVDLGSNFIRLLDANADLLGLASKI